MKGQQRGRHGGDHRARLRGAGGPGSNNGLGIIILKDWEERTAPELGLQQIIPRLMGQLFAMPDAQIFVFNPPPIPGLGTSSGFELDYWTVKVAIHLNLLR